VADVTRPLGPESKGPDGRSVARVRAEALDLQACVSRSAKDGVTAVRIHMVNTR